jgi:hypothetical protein
MELIIKSPKHGEKIVLIDDSDYELIKGLVWRPYISRNTYYASAVIYNSETKKNKHVFMHNLIMDLIGVDHINHLGWDNRRINLRPATQRQNAKNMAVSKLNKYGLKGVSYSKSRNAYSCHITVDYKHIFLGYYGSLIDASNAYNEAAKIHFKEFAQLNYITYEREVELRKLDIPTFKPRGKNKTKFKGISFNKGYYVARKTINKKTYLIGCYKTEQEAIIGYNNYIQKQSLI